MRIIISPAKKMNVDTGSFACEALPQFLPKTEQLYERLRSMSYGELKALWKCNDQIAALNFERLKTMDLRRGLTPAILAYEGIQYQYMSPGVFTYGELDYMQEHLRILSGFYGILRPFDGVTPYRLEMQAKLRSGIQPLCVRLSDRRRAVYYLHFWRTERRKNHRKRYTLQNGPGRNGAVHGGAAG